MARETRAPGVSTESTLDLADRVTTAISTDARLPVNDGMRVLRWPSPRDTVPMAIVDVRHGPWTGAITLLFDDAAPRVRVRIDLDPGCLRVLEGLHVDPFQHAPEQLHHMTRFSLLLHAVPSIIRRVAPQAATDSLANPLPLPRVERDTTAPARADTTEHAA